MKDKKIKRMARRDKRKFIDEQASEAENAAKIGDLKTLYRITKQLSKPEHKPQDITIKDKSGNRLTSKESKLKRWAEHFKEVLNCDPPETIVPAPDTQVDEIGEISTDLIRKDEIKSALKRLKNGKAPGIDNIPGELLKVDPENTVNELDTLFNAIWEREEIPADWTKGTISKLAKKGDLSDCKNWRGITLLSVTSKIFGKIVVERLKNGVDVRLRKEQAAYRRGRSTSEHIFVLRNIVEQALEWQAPLYLNFVDFRRAFDSIHRESLWNIMKWYGIPDKFIQIIKLLHSSTQCCVSDGGCNSEWFSVDTGVKQGCVMAGFLFLLVIDYTMRKTTETATRGIRWKFTTCLEDLDFADDIVLISSAREHMQSKTTCLNKSAKTTGLNVSTEKTKILRINHKSKEPVILNNEPIEEVEEFKYLGSIISKDGGAKQDIAARKKKAQAAFFQLRPVWRSKSIGTRTKIKIYRSNVRAVLLYGSESWRMTEADLSMLRGFDNKCLRRILGIYWPNTISNKELEKTTCLPQIDRELKKRRWTWIGHVLRMSSDADPKIALTWTPEGKRKRGRPKETWRRTAMKEREAMGWRSWNQAENRAKHRAEWRADVVALCARRHDEDE